MPLEAINAEASREKSIRHGHPSTLHLWWARRPLAVCRAVLFGQFVDDPSSIPEEFKNQEEQAKERDRLHKLITALARWENSTSEEIISQAKREIARSVARRRSDVGEAEAVDTLMLKGKPTSHEIDRFLAEKAPPVHDPFCGGGSIPLEAQRLGLRAYASDLNPVATLINKALIEIPPRFSELPPINPEARHKLGLITWQGTQGLSEDILHYGGLIRAKAKQLIGHLYPPALITEELIVGREDLKPYLGRELTVIAWLWARTVTCPNPTCRIAAPLTKTFWLSKKSTNSAWVQPTIQEKTVTFRVMTGKGHPPSETVNRRGATCLCCGNPIPFTHIRQEGKAGRMGQQLMAMVLAGSRERLYLDPIPAHEELAKSVTPPDFPKEPLPKRALGISLQTYGFTQHCDLYTPRQRTMLTTVADLVPAMRNQIEHDANGISIPRHDSTDYATAVATYLGLSVSKLADYNSSLVVWSPTRDQAKTTFTRQALPIIWDYAEVSPFAEAAGDLSVTIDGMSKVIRNLGLSKATAQAFQADAASGPSSTIERVVTSTDPPYYDNIGYADLSDFFYVWLRRSLRSFLPDLFETVLTPKHQELIANPFIEQLPGRTPKEYFEVGLKVAFESVRRRQIDEVPITIYYAFKQEETDELESSVASTGWETMLAGLLKAGLSIESTHPVRTERTGRTRDIGSNALASSIVLVCRKRSKSAPVATRSEFTVTLKDALPSALKRLHEANTAPVDLAQSAIGPGMAVFSSFERVLEPDGSSMSVRSALSLINQVLDEVLAAEEAEYDVDTRWAITWFTQHGFNQGSYGEAEILSKARDTSVAGLREAGIIEARAGKVRLLKRDELSAWHPTTDDRFTIWEACQHLIKTLETDGEAAAARLLKQLDSRADAARDLAYRLYQHCDRKGDAEEARAYNGLVVAWPRLAALAAEEPRPVAPTLDFT